MGGNGPEREKERERGDADNSSVPNLGRRRNVIQLYKKLEIKQKFLLPKNRINISHIAVIVNVQFEKTATAHKHIHCSYPDCANDQA